ncbi:MAG: O-antigen ligase family protein [Solirubrobacterales bacterium]
MSDTQALDRQRPLTALHALAIVLAAAGAWLASVSPSYPWILLAGVLLAYLVLTRPYAFMLVLIAILPWQGALRFPTHSVTIVKLVGALLLVSVALATLLRDRRLRFTPVMGWAGLLCTVVTLSLLAGGLSGPSITETLRYWTLTLFLFLLVQLIDSREAFLRALRVLAISAIVGAVWASVQFLDGSVARASGPISDPNDFAYFLAAVLPFVAYLFMTEPRRRWLWGAGMASLALGILGSSSRGAFVALALTAVWAILTRRVSGVVVASALAAVALMVVLALGLSSAKTSQNLQVRENGLSTSVSLRKVYWSAALRMSANHPLLGIGPGRFEAVSPGYVRNTPKLEREVAVNSTYLGVLSEDGVIALLLFLGFLVATWRQILAATAGRGARGDPAGIAPAGVAEGAAGDPRAPGNWLRSAFLASFLIALTGGVFFSAQLSTPLWLIAAFASALAFLPAGERSSVACATARAAARGGRGAEGPGALAPRA